MNAVLKKTSDNHWLNASSRNHSYHKSSKWFAFPKPDPDARIRLFCLPYAGGGAQIYYPWQEALSSDVEICTVQLPGRGIRFNDKPLCHHKVLVEQLVDAIEPFLDKPYAIFGHSMGALLGYELAQNIRKRGLPEARHLFVSGRRAMHIPADRNHIYSLPETELIEELRKLKGTPEELLKNKELMAMVLPVIRADFELCDTYNHNHNYKKLDMNITAFEGDKDDRAKGDIVSAWQELTHGHFSSKQLAGDHFFIHSSEQQLLHILEQQFTKVNF